MAPYFLRISWNTAMSTFLGDVAIRAASAAAIPAAWPADTHTLCPHVHRNEREPHTVQTALSITGLLPFFAGHLFSLHFSDGGNPLTFR